MDKEKIEELLKIDIFQELGLSDLPEETRNILLDDMTRVIIQGILLRIFENLSPEKQTEFSELFDKVALGEVDSSAIIDFIQTEIPNFEDLLNEEIANYKSLLISNIKVE